MKNYNELSKTESTLLTAHLSERVIETVEEASINSCTHTAGQFHFKEGAKWQAKQDAAKINTLTEALQKIEKECEEMLEAISQGYCVNYGVIFKEHLSITKEALKECI